MDLTGHWSCCGDSTPDSKRCRAHRAAGKSTSKLPINGAVRQHIHNAIGEGGKVRLPQVSRVIG